jgi:hypothetical protein
MRKEASSNPGLAREARRAAIFSARMGFAPHAGRAEARRSVACLKSKAVCMNP